MTAPSINRVLYVEDEPDIQAVARLALEAVGGFTVEICSLGREALAAVKEFAPDIILLDVMMPEMDGPAVLRTLRADPVARLIPIIFMTAKVQPGEVAEYTALGTLGVIPKPFDPMALANQINEMWQQHYGK